MMNGKIQYLSDNLYNRQYLSANNNLSTLLIFTVTNKIKNIGKA